MVKNETHFIMRGGKAEYPSVAHDGLKLWYDTKGKKNDDKHNDTLMDMSGNGKHGELHNFSYKNLSGYQEDSELVFDGIDDKLVLGDVEKPEIISATSNQFNPEGLDTRVRTISGLKPNTDYTMSSNVPYDDNGRVLYLNGLATGENAVWEDKPITQRSTSGGTIWYQIFPDREYNQDLIEGTYWIQLEEGSTATPYVPYIPSIRGTYQINNNIISYDGDTARWVKDGKVIERKGVNAPRRAVRRIGNGRFTESGNTYKMEAINTDSKLEFSAFTPYQNGNLYYHSLWIKTSLESCRVSVYTGIYADYININRSDEWIKLEFIREARLASNDAVSGSSHTNVYFRGAPIHKGDYGMVKDVNIIDLTTTFGAGNEPTLEEIQAEPDKWQWLPNPLDLIEAKELKGNILGDMEDIIDDHTRDEQSGLEVFTDKADDGLVRVEVDGKSYQHAGSGKNLFNVKLFAQKLLDTQPTVAEQITLDGRNVLKVTRGAKEVPMSIKVKPNTRYILNYSRKIENVVTTGSAFMRLNYKDGTYQFVTVGTGDGWSNRTTILNTGSNDEITGVTIHFWQGGIVYLDLDSFQLEEGSTATAYEPPAPNPDYPIEIHSLNDFDVVSSIGNPNIAKNTYEHSYRTTTGNNISIAIGTSAELSLETGKKYTLSFDLRADNPTYSGSMFLNSTTTIRERFEFPKEWKRQSATFVYDGGKYLGIYDILPHLYPQSLGEKYARNIKLEESSVATPYTPRIGSINESDNHPLIDKINLSLSEPLRSVGDVKDRLFRDSDGLWKIERSVGELVLDGVELKFSTGADALQNLGARFTHIPKNSSKNLINSKNAISTHFPKMNNLSRKVYSLELIHQGSLYFYYPYGFLGINDSMSRNERGELGNDWLKAQHQNGTPLTIHYELEEYGIEILDQELQDKLNNLRSFLDSNYVYTIINEADDLPSYIYENLKPHTHTEFLAKDHFKESRTVNNLLIWDRPLEDDELRHQNRMHHERFNMRSETFEGEPINQTISLLNGGMVGHSLEQNYTIKI